MLASLIFALFCNHFGNASWNILYFLQIAWALNKGVKQEYKQFWDVDLGVTYIPWEKVKLDDLDDFAEGGMIDQETVNNGKETLLVL